MRNGERGLIPMYSFKVDRGTYRLYVNTAVEINYEPPDECVELFLDGQGGFQVNWQNKDFEFRPNQFVDDGESWVKMSANARTG